MWAILEHSYQNTPDGDRTLGPCGFQPDTVKTELLFGARKTYRGRDAPSWHLVDGATCYSVHLTSHLEALSAPTYSNAFAAHWSCLGLPASVILDLAPE